MPVVVSSVRLGEAGILWGLPVFLVFGAVGVYLRFRATTTVGPAGITVIWFGAGRSYPWHRIQWLDIRTSGSTHDARVHLTDGRRRVLPGLHRSVFYPSPNFEDNIRQVDAWWKASTHPSARIQPPLKFRDRHPMGFGWLVTLAVLVAVTLLVVAVLTTGSPK
ncbi:PH domain-containing protein [Kitasatospora cinereorecta]|uniref:PH domain-containing protein n=1 Tax=Kitasatospora cinereorecta TaxID=285560 RepID=A0ABW0V6N9_9ACTN